jgi:uncharacterized GH25 family protein
MSRYCLAAILFALIVATAAPAHFVFLVPVDATKGKAVFSDTLKPDDKGVPVERIAGTKLMVIDGGKATDLAWTHDKAANCYTFDVPGTGTRIVVGTTDYGVSQRGESKPMWLRYFPKAVFGDIPAPEKATVGDKVPVELVPVVDGGKLRFKAVAGGKPLAKSDVTVLVPGEEKGKVVATDENGMTEGFDKPGLYGAQVRLVEEKTGELGGKKYEELRQYATLVVTFGK